MKIAAPILSVLVLTAGLSGCSSGTHTGGGAGGSGGAAGGGTGGSGGAGGGGTGGGSALVPIGSFCGVAALKSCDHLKTCGQLVDAQVAECRAAFNARCQTAVRRADAGSVRYDAVAATECVASTYAPPCYGGPEDLYDCLGTVFPVAGLLGAPCDDTPCLEGFCPIGFNTCRACTPFLAQGAACTQFDACNPSVGFCPQAAAAPKCQPLLGPGAECFSGGECAARACVNFGPIDGGISRCAPVALGTPCGSPSDCGSGAYCKGLRIDKDNTVTPGTCATRLALNAPCANEQYDDGCAGLLATCLSGKCATTQPHTRALNAECDAYDQCPVGAYCTCAGVLTNDGGVSVRDGTCQPQQGLNGGCWQEDAYSMCLPGFDCTVHDVCVAWRTEGQPCGMDTGRCAQFLSCFNGTCQAARAPGQSCVPGALPCAAGAYCMADGGCAALKAKAEACTGDDECAAGRCLDADGGRACRSCP